MQRDDLGGSADMTRLNLGRTRAAGGALMAMVWALAGAAQGQMKPKYPIRLSPPAVQAPEQTAPEPTREPAPEPAPSEGWMTQTRKKTFEIGAQPARDVGVMKREIPPILVKARQDPYSLKGLRTCKQLAAEVADLNAVLGADYVVDAEVKENRAGKLAEAGGKSLVNSIIPFRGVVREVTGAAPADRRLKAAIDAGYARRGFLRGVQAKQGCRETF
jgi:hypothetical protein